MRVSPVIWLVSIAVVLIAAFVGSTLLIERNARLLDERAADIAIVAAPSVTALAATRTEMRHLEIGAGHYLGARIAGRPFDRSKFDGWRAAVNHQLDVYGAIPFYPDERPVFLQLVTTKGRLYGDLDHVLALIDERRINDARSFMLDTIDRDGEEIDALLARLITINNDHAVADAHELTTLRQRNGFFAVLLDGAAMLLAAVLLGAAIRAARLYQRTVEEKRRLAEARASELGHFAARVAHDLKAPLASVLLGTSLATAYPSETQRTLQKIQRTSRLMNEMIDALLTVARVEPPTPRAPCTSVANVLDVLIDEVRPSAEAAGAALRMEPYPATATVACSAGVLASILSNILRNAVKYIGGGSGERIITVRVHERDHHTRFEVDDTGPGVPPELEEHVFERYVRGEESTGLGLGLATVKRLVEGVGGRFGVRSRPGCGSCFWVELPCAPDAASDLTARA
ncbi:MAG TPA: HAMP domain-containing sensor histidine kinase [Polyangia bacterium]|nr:HAMP domain-containing sensor histidine kinase [Polyangia bacterium]